MAPSRTALLIVLAGLAAAGLTRGDPDLLLFTRALTWAILGLSTWLLLRVNGRSSLGNAAFFGIAGYAVGLSTTRWDVTNVWLSLALAIAVAGLFGLVVGVSSSRLSGFHFLLLTLAFAEMLRSLATSWSYVGGEDGIAGIRRPSAWPLPIELSDSRTLMWFTAAGLVAVLLALIVLMRSAYGAVLIGIRDSESRMAALGYAPGRYRIGAVVISATVAGLGGALNAYAIRFISPTEFSPLISAKALLFTVVGGAGMLGAVVAAIGLTFVEDALNSRIDRWLFVLGLVYVAIALIGSSPVNWVKRTSSRAAPASISGGPPDDSAPRTFETTPEPEPSATPSREVTP